MSYIDDAVRGIDQQIANLQQARALLLGQTAATAANYHVRATKTPKTQADGSPAPRRQMSEEAKARIREAQQRRWAASKAAGAAPPPAPAPEPAKSEPSAAEPAPEAPPAPKKAANNKKK
jgi:hypothetical protein